MSQTRSRVLLLVGVVVGMTLLILLFRKVNWTEMRHSLTRLELRFVVLALLVSVASMPFRISRWRYMFPVQDRPSFWTCYSAFSVGNMSNNLLPARGGDILRCLVASRAKSVGEASLSLATIALEKVLDGLALLAILLLRLVNLTPPRWVGRLGLLSGMIFLVALVFIILIRYRTSWFTRKSSAMFRAIRKEGWGARVTQLMGRVSVGLSSLDSPKRVALLVVLTLLVWTSEAATVWILARALHLALTIMDASFVIAVLGLGLSLPAAPGFVGTYEFFSSSALRLMGFTLESSLALTLVMHVWSFVVTSAYGFLGLLASGLQFSSVFRPRVTAGSRPAHQSPMGPLAQACDDHSHLERGAIEE